MSGIGNFGRIALRRPSIANTEGYENHGVNDFVDPSKDKLSTFAIDVDTGSYTLSRRKIYGGQLPNKAGVRVEEFVNYFEYDYPTPKETLPFEVAMEAAPSPFGDKDQVIFRVGIQGRRLSEAERKPAHLVFLVDNSGSMSRPDKLPLAQQALHLLVDHLKDGDTVALCTYAGSVTEVLGPTDMGQRPRIHKAIEGLKSGGGTAMADGLETAYKMAYKNLKPGHINRIIVLSDGDANIGQSSHDEILGRIGHYTKEGVTLSTIGLGTGNYKDATMERLADKGNGNYHYIDSFRQARRVFKDQLIGTLQVIAKDVKIQVEFNPEAVAAYRLIGYENRDIKDKDFRNDAVDAGEIGAGHQVTALYALKLKDNGNGSLATLRLRHKAPQGAEASENRFPFSADQRRSRFEEASVSFRRAVAVMALAEKLRLSPHAASWRWKSIEAVAKDSDDKSADHKALRDLIGRAAVIPEDQRAAANSVRRVPKVIPGRPEVEGKLSVEIVRRVIRAHRRELKYCYELELNNNPDVSGKLILTFTIAPTGQVLTSSATEGTLKNRTISTCVASRVRRWVFPEPGDGGVVKVSYPIVMGTR